MSSEKLNRRMTDGRVPSRVILLGGSSYCKDMGSSEMGLIGSRWNTNSTWCCGSAVSNGMLLDPSMSHCHLLGVKALQQLIDKATACGICQHLSVDERLNGKIASNVHRCPTVPDGSSPSIQLATVTCSYGIPSDVECLDLAVSCLQKISGSYFINQNLPCVVSLCTCHTKNHAQKTEQAAVSSNTENRKKCSSKAQECNLPAVSELSTCPTRNDNNSSGNFERAQQRKQQRYQYVSPHYTRSTSKQLIDDVLEPNGASTSNSVTVAIQSSNGALADSIQSECSLESLCLNHHDIMPGSHSTLPVKTRSTGATAAAVANTDKSPTTGAGDRLTEMPPKLKIVRTAAHKPLTRHKQQRLQKVMAKKKQRKQRVAAARQWARRLRLRTVRSQPPSSSLRSLIQSTENEQLHSVGTGSHHVNATCWRHSSHSYMLAGQQSAGSSTAVSSITSACEVLVPKLAVQKRQKNQHLRSADDIPASVSSGTCNRRQISPSAAVECTDVMSGRRDVSASSIGVAATNHPTKSGTEVSRMSALSVDTSIIDCDNIFCNSPASPLPVPRNRMHQNSLLQTPAPLTPRRSAFLHICIFGVRYCVSADARLLWYDL